MLRFVGPICALVAMVKTAEAGNGVKDSDVVPRMGCFCFRPSIKRLVRADSVNHPRPNVSQCVQLQPPVQPVNPPQVADSLIVYLNPFPTPPKRLNIADNAPVNTQYVTMLSRQCLQGELPLEHVAQLLNPYERACFTRYRFTQPLLPHVSVFRIPIRCHMGPGSNWFGSSASNGSLRHHVHEEIWVGLLFAAQSGTKFWLWIAKKESELLGETNCPSLKVSTYPVVHRHDVASILSQLRASSFVSYVQLCASFPAQTHARDKILQSLVYHDGLWKL